jgi:hypothetical protein
MIRGDLCLGGGSYQKRASIDTTLWLDHNKVFQQVGLSISGGFPRGGTSYATFARNEPIHLALCRRTVDS